MSNYPGSIAGKSTKQSEDKQSKIFLVSKPDENKKATKSHSNNPTKKSTQGSNEKKATKTTVVQSKQTPSSTMSNRQQKFYQSWISGGNISNMPLTPILKSHQDESTMSTTINQSEALEPRNNENKEKRVETFGHKSPSKQEKIDEIPQSSHSKSPQKQTNVIFMWDLPIVNLCD